MTDQRSQAVDGYWARPGLAEAIFVALEAAGRDLERLTVDDLAPFDQFHGGGKPATVALAQFAGLMPGTRTLDVGGGLGGPARTLAVEFGCVVTVFDMTREFLEVGEAITARMGLSDRVRFQYGNALELPFPDARFDLVWTQFSGMQIQDKASLYAGFHRVLSRGGRLVMQEPAAGLARPPHFPLMWARDTSTNFLLSPEELLATIQCAGFAEIAWETRELPRFTAPTATSGVAAVSLQQIFLGDALADVQKANEKNVAEGRVRITQGLFERR
jgi:SAM-dependent methyltransferase